jgi:hypothetical protein
MLNRPNYKLGRFVNVLVIVLTLLTLNCLILALFLQTLLALHTLLHRTLLSLPRDSQQTQPITGMTSRRDPPPQLATVLISRQNPRGQWHQGSHNPGCWERRSNRPR